MREAATLLSELGINRETARTALAAGLAGEVLRTSSAHLVDERRVKAVIDRARHPVEPSPEWLEACAGEIFVGRIGPDRTDLRAPTTEQLAAAGGPWRCSIWTLMWWRVRAERGDRVPFVGLVAGLAVVGGEIAGVTVTPTTGRPQAHFDLVPAGAWFDAVRGRRLGPPVGPAWFVAGRRRPLDTIGA